MRPREASAPVASQSPAPAVHSKPSTMRIALSTGGGDAPGLNAVIRAAVLSAVDRGWDVLGIKKGYAGLMGDDEVIRLLEAAG